MKPVKLTREVNNAWMIKDCVLREDGIHFIDRNGIERPIPKYKSIEEMNADLKECCLPVFVISPDSVSPQG